MPLIMISILMLLLLPAAGSAQGEPADWSRIIRGSGWCPPERPCPTRPGLLWDSTNAVPAYPVVLRAVGVGGEVVLTFKVGEDGVVDTSSITVVRSSQRAFDAGSVAAVSRWRFATEADGRPRGSIPVEIQLIYSHSGSCIGTQVAPHIGWAGRNQLVVDICDEKISRSQLHRTID